MTQSFFPTTQYILSVVFLLISSIVVRPQGSPPLLLDDTGTPGDGGWEINLIASVEHSELSNEWEAPLFDINYGLGERIQLKVEFPFLITSEKGYESEGKFDGMKFGVKYRFIGLDDEALSISCYPQVFYSFGENDKAELFLPIECHFEWNTFGLTAEIGHGWIGGESEEWYGGIGAALHFESTTLLMEWHSNVHEIPIELSEPMLNMGFIWDWMECSSLMFSIGKSLHNRRDETKLWGLGGIQFLL